MNGIYGSYDTKLAHSVQHDYQQEAANYRLTKGSAQRSSLGKMIVSKSLPLIGTAIALASLFILVGNL